MEARIKWIEDAAFVAEADSGHAQIIDGSPEIGGRNRGMRPMEMLLLGLGGCSAMDVIHILRKGRHPVEDCVIRISADRAENPPRVFTRIHLHFVVTGTGLKESVVARAVSLSAEKYCSASIMLSKAVHITHDHEVVEA